jgi:cell division protein FtsW
MSFFLKHVFAVILSFALIIVVQFISIKTIRKWAKVIWLFALVVVIITMLFGEEENQATRSLFGFRTFDLMKFAFPIYFARILAQRIDTINSSFKSCARYILLPAFLSIIIFFKDNVSTLLILFFVFSAILFISDVRFKYKFYLFATFVGIIGVLLLWQFTLGAKYSELKIGRLETAINRIEAFSNGEKNKDQTIRAEAVVQSAGLIGVGPGQSYNKDIPQIESDFIFCLIVEEYGLIVAAAIVACYLFLLLYSWRIIKKLEDKFSIYAISGITLMIVFQAFVHVLVNVGGPNTGQTLPYISQGRVSIFVTAIAFGIIINLSSRVRKIN